MVAVTRRLADQPAEDALDHDPTGELVTAGTIDQLHQDRVGDACVGTAANIGRVDESLEVVEVAEDLGECSLTCA